MREPWLKSELGAHKKPDAQLFFPERIKRRVTDMSMQSLEREILKEAKAVFNNSKLRLKDIMEWSNSEEAVKKNLRDVEVMAELPTLGVWVCVKKEHDKR